MNIKHIIITRFLCTNFNGISDDKLLSNENIKYHFDLLKSNLLRSLSAQTTKNFELVILIHRNLKKYNKSTLLSLQQLKYDFPIKLMVVSDLRDYVYGFYKNHDRVITSRIDLDDFISHNVIEELQKYSEGVQKICLYGFKDGFTMQMNNDGRHLYYMKPSSYAKKEIGYLAILLSLIVNTSSIKVPCTILDTKDHTDCITFLKQNPQKFGLDVIDFKHYHYVNYAENQTYTYIYYRHNKSDSVRCGQKIDQYNDVEIKEKYFDLFV